MGKPDIARLESDVESFAEIGEFIDLPVRNYSSGMIVRLAFAMATAAQPEILLMDEWIMAGDTAFLEKAKRRVETMVRHADILVLASHSSAIIAQWCNRVIWLEHGKILADGRPLDVFSEYLPPEQFKELIGSVRMAPPIAEVGPAERLQASD
jgi:lipopolysaccharide transport system ATP-binding protein